METDRHGLLINRLIDHGNNGNGTTGHACFFCQKRIIGKRVVRKGIVGVGLIDQGVKLTAQVRREGISYKVGFVGEGVIKDGLNVINGIITRLGGRGKNIIGYDILITGLAAGRKGKYRDDRSAKSSSVSLPASKQLRVKRATGRWNPGVTV